MGIRHLDIMRTLVDCYSQEMLKKLLIQERKCIVRLYMLNGLQLASKDNGSESDPYVYVTLGDQVFNDRANYQNDEPNPDIYQRIDFEAVFPGCPMLKIQMWDADLIFGDDLIGETLIDVEDRYFSADWNSITDKPAEMRQLHHPSSKVPQGSIILWQEIIPTTVNLNQVETWDIAPKPVDEFELRVVVWDTEGIPMMDVEGTTDGFFKLFLDENHSKETDTHYRNTDGSCSFNYRLLFPTKFQKGNSKHGRKMTLTVQGYDRDLLSSNDLIGEAFIDLKPLYEDAELSKRPMSLSKKYFEYLEKEKGASGLTFTSDNQSFWVELERTPTEEERLDKRLARGEKMKCGKVRLQIDLCPKKDAEAKPVGAARDEPNSDPHLPLPSNRLSLSLNPLKMV